MASLNLQQRVFERWNELVANNPRVTPLMKANLSQITNADIIKVSKKVDIDYFNKKYPTLKNDPYFLAGSELMITVSPQLSIDVVREYQNDISVTGTRETFNFKSSSEALVIETIIHDILSIYKLTGKAEGVLNAVYYTDEIKTSAALVPFYALKEALTETDIIRAIFEDGSKKTPDQIGTAVGGLIASLYASDNFASQLISQSLGQTLGSIAAQAINYKFDLIDDPDFFVGSEQSLSLAAIYKRLPGSFISTGISLGSAKLASSLIKTFKIEDPLTQIGVNTLVTGSVSYIITSQVAKEYPLTAVKLFGAPPEVVGGKVVGADLSKLSFSGTLESIGASAFASFAGSYLYQKLIRWNILSENISTSGVAIGATIGGTIGSIIPGVGTAIGAFVGTLLGSVLGGLFGDKDYPRAFGSVIVVNNQFILTSIAVDDKGNYDIAYNMGNTAKDSLTMIVGLVGGKVFSIRDFRYGHYLKDYVYRPSDLGLGAYDYPYRFSSPQDAILAGVIQQVQSVQIEGGDLYVKRILSALPSDVKTLEQLNATFQVAREWGIYRDNSVLYDQNINYLKASAVKDADAKIIDLRSHSADAFDPKSQAKYFGNALKFDGNDYVAFQSSVAPTGNQSYTIEAWVKPDKTGALGIVGWGTYGKSNAVNGLKLEADGIRNYWQDNDIKAAIKVSLNEWHHIAANYDSATGIRKIYLDGQKVAEGRSSSPNIATNSNFTIGKTFDQEYFSGQIDDVRIWNVARTDDQIAAQMNRQLKGNETGLVGYWNLNEGKGTTIQDLAAAKKAGAIQGATWVPYDSNLRDFGINVLPSQIQLSLQGNNLIINGEIIPNWLTTSDRLEILRFADGSRFKIVASNGTVRLDDERVANWEEIKTKATQLNLDAAKPSDNYLSPNASTITNLGLGGIGDDVLISKFSSQTLSGGKGDDIYRYNRGQGTIYLNDVGGLDTLEFDASIKSSDLLVQQSGIDLILALKNPANPSATVAQLTDKVVISNFFNQKIEVIRFGNNQEVAIESLIPSFSVNGISQKVITVSSSLYYLTSATTWNNAQAQAKAMGGNLVTINSKTEQDFLVNKFGTNEHFWVGLNDVKQEGKFEWVSGEPVNFTNWAAGEPNNASNEDYIHLSKFSNGSWNDLDERFYPNGFDGRAIKGIVEVPSPNAVIFSDTVYYLTTASSWTNAQAQAKAMGGNLVTINSKVEQDLLFTTFGKTESFWTGLNDAKQEGKFEWVSGEPVTYTNWAAGEPNNGGGNENYALMWNARGGLWNDGTENTNIRGIVEVNRLFTGNDKGNLYQYRLGDGNEVIYDIGNYEGTTRDGGLDILEFGAGITINSLKLTLDNNNLIVKVNNTATITIRDGIKAQSKIETFRFSDGKEYNPTLSFNGTVSLQATFSAGDPTYNLAKAKPEIFATSPHKLLTVDLAGDGLQLISAQESMTLSDPDNDTYPEQTGWVAPSDGFLVMDRNNDGVITGLNEFFSLQKQTNVSFLGDLDTNKDLIIDTKDANFQKLRIWIDNNLNGDVELGELSALYRYGINSISVIPQTKNFNVAGNSITASAYFTRIGFETKPVSQLYDVAYTYKRDGLKIEQLALGVSRFNYENKPDIVFADDSGQNINLTIDPNEIYSATGGKGNDIFTVKAGSTKGAVLSGGDGDDRLIGSNGNDILTGGAGRDAIDGGASDDVITIDKFDDLTKIKGGAGFDVLVIEGDGDVSFTLDNLSVEVVNGNQGNNTLTAIGTQDVIISGNGGNDRITGGQGGDRLEGNEGHDVLNGGAGNDNLNGGAGNDTLNGGAGIDTLVGGTSNDTYIVDSVTDIIIELANQGTDTTQSSVTFSLLNLANIENLILTGTSAINGTGNSANNILAGNSANNVFDGKTGADTLIGSLGNDSYLVDNVGDKVIETSSLLTEIDSVQSIISYTLGANVEKLTLLGNTAINGTGNALNNTIIGNISINTLNGNSGNDILTGAGGQDTLTGGLGSDRFGYKTLTDSLLANFDVITDFNAIPGNDLFLVTTVRSAFTNVGAVTTLDNTGITTKLTTTNFGANSAAQLTFGSRTFVAINDAIAGFSQTTDAIIEITGLTGTLGVSNFVIA